MGCYVPAKSFTLTPFDRIFCRIGASDRLLEGKSTFFIEMEETKTILQHCSPRSLVIIDELGRGTSTYDGVAIASAVLKHLVTNLGPKTLFATHYHILLDEFALYENILNTVMKHHYNEVNIHKYRHK
jgi:DNA mismatch repair protein MSH6